MAKASGSANNDVVDTAPSSGMERLTNVLALLLVKGHNQTEAIRLLNRAGFQAKEIAALVGSTSNTVSVTLYKTNKTGKKAKKSGKD